MTFAPARLVEVRTFFQSMYPWLTNAELGIVGGPSHVAKGTSYHLGADQLKMHKDPYSTRTRRDRAGLSHAASAFDVDDGLGGGPEELRQLSRWAVSECRAGAADSLDIREIIFSPDGVAVLTWDREKGRTSFAQPRGDLSHREHTHFSFYRDSEQRPKVGFFQRFYAQRSVEESGMFFLKTVNDPAVYVSNGINTRWLPGGQVELTLNPLRQSGVLLLEYPDMGALLNAGGPLVKDEPTMATDEQLERVLRRVLRSVPEN